MPARYTTILEGIREVAPHVTFSADGTAPANGASVGVVVVGETPYAEGFGDVGGPVCGWCTPPQQEPKSLTLQPADRAVVDRVCAAVPTCVVLIVSGRPQVVTDQLPSIDALVASWLPGSEGAGVADVLFGRRPFTGRLSVTWPATVAQVPINVGDRDYHPLYPYGWGLSTKRGHSSALPAAAWNADGSLRTDAATLRAAGRSLTRDPGGRPAILSALRDAAQSRVLAGHGGPDWASRLAEADRAETAGATARAFALLSSVITA